MPLLASSSQTEDKIVFSHGLYLPLFERPPRAAAPNFPRAAASLRGILLESSFLM
eukprot:COSAG01_NODE_67836_length_265_cov_441.150602_1_plen_54_part_10